MFNKKVLALISIVGLSAFTMGCWDRGNQKEGTSNTQQSDTNSTMQNNQTRSNQPNTNQQGGTTPGTGNGMSINTSSNMAYGDTDTGSDSDMGSNDSNNGDMNGDHGDSNSDQMNLKDKNQNNSAR